IVLAEPVGDALEGRRRLVLEPHRRTEADDPGLVAQGHLAEEDQAVRGRQRPGAGELLVGGAEGAGAVGAQLVVGLAVRKGAQLLLVEVHEQLAADVRVRAIGVEGADPAHDLGGLEGDLRDHPGQLAAGQLAAVDLADQRVLGQVAARRLQPLLDLLDEAYAFQYSHGLLLEPLAASISAAFLGEGYRSTGPRGAQAWGEGLRSGRAPVENMLRRGPLMARRYLKPGLHRRRRDSSKAIVLGVKP